MEDGIIVLREYGNALSARLAAVAREANGVPAQVSVQHLLRR